LAVLIDRGHREYPIQPDVSGLALETERDQMVEAKLEEMDGEDRVEIVLPRREMGEGGRL
jgi:pyrimidine operon attenuation protein/uracil phosphoribosyltransferase